MVTAACYSKSDKQLQLKNISHLHTYFIEFGLPLSLCNFSIYFVTSLQISSGNIFGTSLMENFPITFLGMTVLPPGALKAPSIPGIKNVI